jgi:hypothetical protein
MQGLFKNDFPGLMFQNFLGRQANWSRHLWKICAGADIWDDYQERKVGIICAMIAIYRILFFIFIKLSEKLAPGLRVMAREYFSR